ncbi:unnamed protein product, partial [Iphiclides podalirius]
MENSRSEYVTASYLRKLSNESIPPTWLKNKRTAFAEKSIVAPDDAFQRVMNANIGNDKKKIDGQPNLHIGRAC